MALGAAHESCNTPACDLERNAAGQKQKRVEVKNRGKRERSPVERRTFANDQGAGKGRKRHRDGKQDDPNARRRRRRRVILHRSEVSAGWRQIPPAAIAAAWRW